MSKVKRTKSTSAGMTRWDAGLLAETFSEDDWRLFVAFMIPEKPSGVEHLAALAECIGTRLRKRFVAISREELIQSVKDEGKGTAGGGKKGGKGAASDKGTGSLFPEVCERIRQALSSPAGVTPDLDARLIKYYLLKKKREHLMKKEAERKAKEEVAAPKSGRESTKGTKSAAAPKGGKGSPKKGAAEVKESDVPMPVKAESKMKKRGEEDSIFTSIDDEPEDGPETYIIVHGFTHAAVVTQCAEIGVPINTVVKIRSSSVSSPTQVAEETQACDGSDGGIAMGRALAMFWSELQNVVKLSPSGHALRDVAWLELLSEVERVPDVPEEKADFAESLFSLLVERLYKLLEQRKQYSLYLQTLHAISLSTKLPNTTAAEGPDGTVSEGDPFVAAREVDTRLYHHLMDSVPTESVTIPLVMNCMLEQVVATVDGGGSDSVLRSSQDDDPLNSILDASIMKLALRAEEKQQLLVDKDHVQVARKQNGPVILQYHDASTKKTHFLGEVDNLDASCAESRMLQLLPYYHMRDFTLFGAKLDGKHRASCLARAHELNHILSAYDVERPLLDRSLKQFLFECMPLTGTGIPPSRLFKSTANIQSVWDDPYPVSVLPVSDVEELEATHLESLPSRRLDAWCYHEHLEPSVMLQVLHNAHAKRLHIDTYYHKASSSLLITLHNPHEKHENHYSWSSWIQSHVGFSNYLQHVVSAVGPTVDAVWAMAVGKAEQKAKMEAERREREQAEARRKREQEEKEKEKQNEKEKEKEREKEKRSPSSARSKSSRASKEGKSGSRASKEGKSGSRSNTSSRGGSSRKGKEKDKPPPDTKKTSSQVAVNAQASAEIPPVEPPKPELPKLYYAYIVGDRVLRVNGTASHLFPADGGMIAVKREAFIDGHVDQVVSVEKNGCSILLHARCGPEDSMTVEEDTDSQENDDSKSESSREDELIKRYEKQQQAQRSQFSSFTIHYDDGLIASVSKLGPEGRLPHLEPLKQLVSKPSEETAAKPPTPPQQSRAPSVQKGGKKKDVAAEQALVEQRLQEEESERQRQAEEEKKIERLDMALRPRYQQLFVSAPDGLHLHFSIVHEGKLEELNETSHLEGGRVVIRQSYPTKTHGLQACEKARLKPAMEETSRCITSNGLVVKFLRDGSTVVLYPDGAVSVSDAGNADALATACLVNQMVEQKDDDRVSSAVRRVKFGGSLDLEQGGGDEKTGRETERNDVWMSVSSSGERRIHTAVEGGHSVSEHKVLSYTATDPQTKEVMFSRADGVCIVRRPDGSCVVNHRDGTRITTFYEMEDGQSVVSGVTESTGTDLTQFVCVECPGFAAVTFNCQSQECKTSFGEGSCITSTNRGEYRMERPDGSIVDVAYDGEVCYIPKNAGSQAPGVEDVVLVGAYVFSPSADEMLKVVDQEGTKHTVMQSGQTVVETNEKCNSKGEEQTPRFFILRQDGSAVELLRHSDVAEFLEDAETDPQTMVVREPVEGQPGAHAITVLRPSEGTTGDKWLRDYKEDGVIPRGLRDRSFQNLSNRPEGQDLKNRDATNLSQSEGTKSTALPHSPALEFRQLIEYPPLSADERRTVMEGFCMFLRWRQQQYQQAASLLMEDQRNEGEKATAKRLERKLMPRDKALVQDSLLQSAQEVYHGRSEEELTHQYNETVNKCEEPVAERSASEADRRVTARMEEHQRELDDLEMRLDALRKNSVPNYFEMPEGMTFLEAALKAGPNMNALASQLPENQNQSRRTFTGGRSTSEMELVAIQSSHSIASDSAIDPGLGAVSQSPEKVTPSPIAEENPVHVYSSTSLPILVEESVSDVAAPSPLRPKNPTPVHASGDSTSNALRPTNPTPVHGVIAAGTRPINPTPGLAGGTNGQDTPTSVLHTISEPGDVSGPVVDACVAMHRQSMGDVDQLLPGGSNKSVYLDVTGQPRKQKVKKPLSLLGSRPGATTNEQFVSTEDPVRRKVFTSSVAGSTAKGTSQVSSLRGFELFPPEVNFGVLREGYTYAYPLVMRNIGIDSCRFKLKQPPPSTGLKVVYSPGPVAAGMSVKLDVEIFAVAVGAVGSNGLGSVEHALEVTTETSILHLPIKAVVVTAAVYDSFSSEDKVKHLPHPRARLVATKPPSREALGRTRRPNVAAASQ